MEETRPTKEPMENDYRCCCGSMSAKVGFIILTILSQSGVWLTIFLFGFLLVIYGFTALFTLPFLGPLGILAIIPVLLCLLIPAGYVAQFVYFCLSICQPKAQYMKVFGVLSVVLNGLTVLAMLVAGIIGFVVLMEKLHNDSYTDEEYHKHVGGLISLLLTIILTILWMTWWLRVSHQYYTYLKNHERYLAENPPPQYNFAPQNPPQMGAYPQQPSGVYPQQPSAFQSAQNPQYVYPTISAQPPPYGLITKET
ncbi:unnamed protein product, partial [Mesorhabditis belari]|uniref:Uncharacterized protein n=1 Tax=Mesorhabditis belari TaxID=2138241 RepID=A0AAF3EUY9_9BILA